MKNNSELVSIIKKSTSPAESLSLGKKLAEFTPPGTIICLEGNLSAGKTIFAQGFASGLKIEEPVTSPTFPIIQEYSSTPPLYHMDLYRLHSSEDFMDIGGEEYLYSEGICLIEWPDRAQDIFPENCVTVEIEITGENTRRISFSGPSSVLKEFIDAI